MATRTQGQNRSRAEVGATTGRRKRSKRSAAARRGKDEHESGPDRARATKCQRSKSGGAAPKPLRAFRLLPVIARELLGALRQLRCRPVAIPRARAPRRQSARRTSHRHSARAHRKMQGRDRIRRTVRPTRPSQRPPPPAAHRAPSRQSDRERPDVRGCHPQSMSIWRAASPGAARPGAKDRRRMLFACVVRCARRFQRLRSTTPSCRQARSCVPRPA